jgi:polyisoprenyl-teichoic acid--peptidoglycan teichoic acid transferase
MLRSKLFLFCAALLTASLGLSAAAYNWQRNLWANQTTIMVEFPLDQVPTPKPNVTRAPIAEIQLPKVWDGKDRVNILVLGIDEREGEKDPGYRTDTMIVLTVDPVTKRAGLLSIPRDTWVNIPGFEFNRINVANQLGDAYDYPGGGPGLAQKTVESLLGITIHYTVRMNFTAFEKIVDRIGGVDVDVDMDISDPTYPTSDYGVELFELSKGKQVLDGPTALKYARTRHNLPNGDFDRARHQQQVILAVREKVTKPAVLASLMAQAPALIDDLSTSIRTDMTLDQMQQLAVLAAQLNRGSIKMAVLDQNYTEFKTTSQGWQVQIPIRSKIAELRDEFFTSSTASLSGQTESTTP